MTFILTLESDSSSQQFFEHQRQQFFPKKRNLIPAHISVFHTLPEEQFAAIDKRLALITQEQCCIPFAISGIRFLGNGNAYSLSFDESIFLALRNDWMRWLTNQDKHKWQPHVTIQNKVSGVDAHLLNKQLVHDFKPSFGMLIKLNLWRYLDGPWEFIKSYAFKADAED